MDLNSLKPKKFLSLGHHDLPHVGDLGKDFFVAVGCSYTAGAGLRYTDTWASRLGKKLNMEHINLGLDGSSVVGDRPLRRLLVIDQSPDQSSA